jgi:hypothetical protein
VATAAAALDFDSESGPHAGLAESGPLAGLIEDSTLYLLNYFLLSSLKVVFFAEAGYPGR